MAYRFSSLQRAGWTFLALLFLVISWLWDRLNRLISWLVDLMPLARLKAQVVAMMAQLPPYPTLFVFFIPFIVTEPLKIISIWMLATGQVIGSALVYLGAQLIQLGLVSFIFNHCKEKLLSIAWFAQLYVYVVRVHDWADAQVQPVKDRARALIAQGRLMLLAYMAQVRGGAWGQNFRRHIVLLWARMRKH